MKHPVDTSKWGEFKARDLFGPSKLGKYHNPKDLQASDDGYEYICATTMNNGINQTLSCVIGNNLTIPFKIGGGLSLTPSHIIAWGKQNPYFTYHENPCVTSQGMYFVEVKNKTRNQIHFLITVLNKLSSEFGYTNCLTGKIFDELSIPLPLKPSADPSNYTPEDIDWAYMEMVMSRVTARAKDRLANLPQPTEKQKTPVDTSGWGEFVVGELFDVQLSDGDNKPKKLPKGNIPLVSAGNTNNGIVGLFESDTIIFPAHSITVDMFGQAFYQPKKFQAVSHGRVNILVPNFETNENIDQFIVTILNAQCQKYSFTEMLTSKKIKAETIKLPLKPSADLFNYNQEDIDWDYMDRFMQVFEEKAHERVVSLKEQI